MQLSAFVMLRDPGSRAHHGRMSAQGIRHEQTLITRSRRRTGVLFAKLRERTATMRTTRHRGMSSDSVAIMDGRVDRIGSAERGENPTVLAELPSGYAVIGAVQFLPGYCVLFGQDPHATALAEMPRKDRVQSLADADLLATAVEQACREADPAFRRVNIDNLGNADAFVHAHIWPRYEWEPPELVRRPVWLYELTRWTSPTTALSDRHNNLRAAITSNLLSLAESDAVRVTD